MNLLDNLNQLASKGRYGDTMLAHVTPEEANLLKLLGGSGTINPDTGLPEFFSLKSAFKGIVNSVKDVGRDIDSFVRDEIPGGWVTVGALAGGAYLGGTGAFGGAAEGAATGAFDAGVGGIAEAMGAGAPISTAAGATAAELLYPGIEVTPTYSTVPGSFQSALPELGVQTAATTAPFTAIPGSFPAAISGGLLGMTGIASPSISLNNIFRGAQLANNLFGRPQQPQVNPYQLMQQQQAGLVDYSPTLNLLATRPTPQSLV